MGEFMGDVIQLKASFQAIPPTALEEREVAYNFPMNCLFFGDDEGGIQAGYLSDRSDDAWEQYLDNRYSRTTHNHTISRFEAVQGRDRLKIRRTATSGSEYNALDTDGRCKYLHWSGSVRFALQVDSTWMFLNPDPSDRRFKRNITPEDSPERWESALQGLMAIPLVSYDWNVEEFPIFDETRINLGVIAQDLEAINPDLVITDPDGYQHVNLSHCVVQLVAAIKGLNARVEAMEP